MEISAFLALMGSLVVSRAINERGYRQLTAEEKLRLMDGFSATRMYAMVPLFGLVALLWFMTHQTELPRQVVTMAYFVLLGLYVITRTILNQRKLIQLQMPAWYQQSFLAAQAVALLGLAWFFYALFGR